MEIDKVRHSRHSPYPENSFADYILHWQTMRTAKIRHSGRVLRLDKPVRTLVAALFIVRPPFFDFPLLHLLRIGMLRRVKHIDQKTRERACGS
jgi:hypothetical protein